MKKKICVLFFLISVFYVAGQTLPKEYQFFILKADSLYKAKDYKGSGLAYSKAFKEFGGKGLLNDRYNAAKSWAKANIPDSAFFHLFRLTEKAYFREYDRVVNEADFKPLQADKRWNQLLGSIKQNMAFNFGAERVRNLQTLPDGWFTWGTRDYIMRAGSSVKHTGKYAIVVEPMEDIEKKSFGCPAYSIPAIYSGKEIELKAYIKMENVDDAIGLLLRLDGKEANKSLGFDNMMQKKINGTKDWTQYSVKLPLHVDTKTIFIGVINSGSGKYGLMISRF